MSENGYKMEENGYKTSRNGYKTSETLHSSHLHQLMKTALLCVSGIE